MGVNGLQDDKAYAAHGAHLHSVLEELGEAQLRKKRALARAHMIEVHGAEPDEYGRVDIMVSTDGSWPIRGYSSCSGQGALIYEDGAAFPPTVIAQQCRGRYCSKCVWYENNASRRGWCRPNFAPGTGTAARSPWRLTSCATSWRRSPRTIARRWLAISSRSPWSACRSRTCAATRTRRLLFV